MKSPTICYALNCWAIISDCVEYHEWKFNERVNGSIYSIYTFSRKIGSALASTFLSFSLVICGFDTSMNIQPEVVSRNIRILVTSIPLLACGFVIIGLGFVYNISNEDSKSIHHCIMDNRQSGERKDIS